MAKKALKCRRSKDPLQRNLWIVMRHSYRAFWEHVLIWRTLGDAWAPMLTAEHPVKSSGASTGSPTASREYLSRGRGMRETGDSRSHHRIPGDVSDSVTRVILRGVLLALGSERYSCVQSSLQNSRWSLQKLQPRYPAVSPSGQTYARSRLYSAERTHCKAPGEDQSASTGWSAVNSSVRPFVIGMPGEIRYACFNDDPTTSG